MGVFTWLRSKNMEPSTPRKIGIGMIIAAVGFLVILIGSIGLVSPHELQYVENGVTKVQPCTRLIKSTSILVDEQLPYSYHCRIVPEPDGSFVCVESCTGEVPGIDAGRMAIGYCGW
jgi:hypothetical protein